MIQPLAEGTVVPPPALLTARKPARPATVSTVPIASRQPRGVPNQKRKMTTRKTSSLTMSGWTTVSPPNPSAVAWKTKDPIMAKSPTYQIGRRSTWRRSFKPLPFSSEAVSTPSRWKIVVSALHRAAQTASGIANTILCLPDLKREFPDLGASPFGSDLRRRRRHHVAADIAESDRGPEAGRPGDARETAHLAVGR